MAIVMTSAFADEACKLDGVCDSDAKCKAVNASYSVVGGKCINPAANEGTANCDGIVNSAGAKVVPGSAADTSAKGSDTKQR